MVDLQDARGPAVGEALDDRELPEGTIRRERGRHDPADQRVEFGLPARGRAGAAQHVLAAEAGRKRRLLVRIVERRLRLEHVAHGQREGGEELVFDLIRDEIKKQIPKDFDAFLINPAGSFGGAKRGTNLELSVRGADYSTLKEKVGELTKRFKDSGMMTDVDTDFRDGVTEVHVEPDREKAAASGVSVLVISSRHWA